MQKVSLPDEVLLKKFNNCAALSANQIIERTGASARYVRQRLSDLTDQGLLIKEKFGREFLYKRAAES